MSTVAVVHPTTLLGKELCDALGRGGLAGTTWQEVRLLSTREAEVGTLTQVAGAAALVQRYEPASLEGVALAYFCGPIAANRPLLAELPAATTAVVLSPDATAADGRPVVAGINGREGATGGGGAAEVLLSPHPAVVLLAHLLHPLRGLCEPRQATATVIQPASMYDEAGIEELFEQTRHIVAMTPRRQSPVFGAQLAFNLLPAAGAEETAETIGAALGSVLAAPRLAISAQLLQGAVFHCMAASLYVQCGGGGAVPSVQAVRKALAASPYVEIARDGRHLGPVDAAANDKVLAGSPRRDDGGIWIWAVMDNLTRGGATNAIEIAAAVN
jgi:aspartate-semialdehyde dehydrogenase